MLGSGRVMSDVYRYGLWVTKEYMSGGLGVQDFARELGGVYFFARQHLDDLLLNRLASAVMACYAEYSGGYIAEKAFQEELASAILEFEQVERNRIQS